MLLDQDVILVIVMIGSKFVSRLIYPDSLDTQTHYKALNRCNYCTDFQARNTEMFVVGRFVLYSSLCCDAEDKSRAWTIFIFVYLL